MNLNQKVNTCIVVSGFSKEPRYDFSIYGKGYRNAAQILSHEFQQRISFTDYDGYPIIFLYRQSLELYLKGLIYKCARLSSFLNFREIDKKLNSPQNNKTHNLDFLSKKSTDILLAIFPKDKDILRICHDIKVISSQYSNLDKDSFSYRYPIDNKGNYSTKKNQCVNITSLSQVMDKLLEEIEILDFGLDVKTDKTQQVVDIFSQLIAEDDQ